MSEELDYLFTHLDDIFRVSSEPSSPSHSELNNNHDSEHNNNQYSPFVLAASPPHDPTYLFTDLDNMFAGPLSLPNLELNNNQISPLLLAESPPHDPNALFTDLDNTSPELPSPTDSERRRSLSQLLQPPSFQSHSRLLPPPPSYENSDWDLQREWGIEYVLARMTFCPGIPQLPVAKFLFHRIEEHGFEDEHTYNQGYGLTHQEYVEELLMSTDICQYCGEDRATHDGHAREVWWHCENNCLIHQCEHESTGHFSFCFMLYLELESLHIFYNWPEKVELPWYLQCKPNEQQHNLLRQNGYIEEDCEYSSNDLPRFTQQAEDLRGELQRQRHMTCHNQHYATRTLCTQKKPIRVFNPDTRQVHLEGQPLVSDPSAPVYLMPHFTPTRGNPEPED